MVCHFVRGEVIVGVWWVRGQWINSMHVHVFMGGRRENKFGILLLY